jgi:hypothetical protein
LWHSTAMQMSVSIVMRESYSVGQQCEHIAYHSHCNGLFTVDL